MDVICKDVGSDLGPWCSYLLASNLLEYPNLVPDLSIPILMVKTLFLLLMDPIHRFNSP